MHICHISMLLLAVASAGASVLPNHQAPLIKPNAPGDNITQRQFDDFEELSRIVDIAYCVGTMNTGIDPPFQCLSYCKDFPSFELVETWNTGMTLSDSCGFVALSQPPAKPRIIVAFRGTYSIVNALADLSLARQEYLPYPSDGHSIEKEKCEGCTVHAGFLESWSQTEKIISPIVEELVKAYPEHRLTLVGHSLGGAVAALAGLDFKGRGWDPVVTTFGEPKSGNRELAGFFNRRFSSEQYRRITHINDPVPLVPFASLGYHHHAHEYFISKHDLPYAKEDVRQCEGSEDPTCVAGTSFNVLQALTGHRDYFHRLGLCLPADWVHHQWTGGELR
ncbi:alpha/beta-hydrolase [Wilcoxina mikolae CBS 423.85]|nr:alpha/beta-hydrolase [Wilcoxina mikolae CBS 423.85]